MRRLAMLIFGCALAHADAHAQVTSLHVDVLGFGQYSLCKADTFPAPDTPSGSVYIAVPEILVPNCDTIEARQGVVFGFHYLLSGAPIGEPVQIRTVVMYPPPGVTTPDGEHFEKSEYTVTRTIGGRYSVGCALEKPWEVIPGDWTIQLWWADRLLVEKTFHLVARKGRNGTENGGPESMPDIE